MNVWVPDGELTKTLGSAWLKSFKPCGSNEQMLDRANAWLAKHGHNFEFTAVRDVGGELEWQMEVEK